MGGERTVEASVVQAHGDTLLCRGGSGHWMTIDSSAGKKSSTPMEVLLMAAGACTELDVIYILRKMKVRYQKLVVSLKGTKREEEPTGFEHIHLTYEFWGDVPEDKARRAVELSMEKYCSVSWTLKGRAKMDWDIVIHPAEDKNPQDMGA